MSLFASVVLFHVPVAPTGAPLTDYFGYGFLTGNDSLPGSFDETFSPPWVPTGDSADQYLPEFAPYNGPPATTGPSGAVHDSPLPPYGVMLDDPPVDPLTPTFFLFGELGDEFFKFTDCDDLRSTDPTCPSDHLSVALFPDIDNHGRPAGHFASFDTHGRKSARPPVRQLIWTAERLKLEIHIFMAPRGIALSLPRQQRRVIRRQYLAALRRMGRLKRRQGQVTPIYFGPDIVRRAARYRLRRNRPEPCNLSRLPTDERIALRHFRRDMRSGKVISTQFQNSALISPSPTSMWHACCRAMWTPMTTLSLHALHAIIIITDVYYAFIDRLRAFIISLLSRLEERFPDYTSSDTMMHSIAKRMYYRAGHPGRGPPPPMSWRTIPVMNKLRRVAVNNAWDNLRLAAAVTKLHLVVLIIRNQSATVHTKLHASRVRSRLVDLHALLLIRRADLTSPAYVKSFMVNLTRLPTIMACMVAAHPFLMGICTLPLILSTDGHGSSRPPMFDGSRANFLAWIMSFSGFVSWKLTDCVDILDGTETEPVIPAPIPGVNPGDPPTNQADIEAAVLYHRDWLQRNRKLYGLLIQAVPDWLRTSIYNDYRNNGYQALEHLRASFDVVDANDHAACISRLQTSYIDPRNDLREDDLRIQFDSMQVALAGIVRAGQAPPADATLKAMFDNSLPMSYTHVRQLVRRQNHGTFVAHYADYVSQVRAELASRSSPARAFAATSFLPRPPATDGDGGGDSGSSGNRTRTNGGGQGGNGTRSTNSICLRCGNKGHLRPKCRKEEVKCRHCGADHMTEFCEKAGNSAARERLTPGTKALVRRDMRRPGGKASVGAAHEVTVAPDRATPPPPQAPAPPTAAHTGSSTTLTSRPLHRPTPPPPLLPPRAQTPPRRRTLMPPPSEL